MNIDFSILEIKALKSAALQEVYEMDRHKDPDEPKRRYLIKAVSKLDVKIQTWVDNEN